MTTTTSGSATDLITFSRGSLATVTDSDGYIKWAPHNLLLASEQFDTTSWTKTSATIAANSIAAPDNAITADTIAASGANGTVLQSYTAVAVPYVFSVWLRRKTGTGNIQIAADNGTYTTVTITNDWALYTVTQTPTAGTKSAGIRIVTSGDEVYAWGAHLYRSDLGGMQANASAYPYYNPSTPKNLLGYSEAFDNAYWTKDGTTIAANSILGPNGLQTADAITPTAANNYHYILGAYTSVIGRPVTASFYAKAGTHSFIQFAAGGDNPVANFNVSTGTVGTTTSITSAAITSVGNGWYRCSVLYQAGATSTSFVLSIVDSASAARIPIWNAAGTETVYIWGAQLSDSASLDPYVGSYGAAPSPAAAYGPRLDYDPSTLAAKGLLVEEQRTNLLIGSNQLTTGWSSDGTATLATNAAISPTGAMDASQLQYGTATYRYQVVTLTAAAYTFSVYAKQGTGGNGLLRLRNQTLTLEADFNLSTGASSNVTAGVTAQPALNVGNGWWRFAITFTGTAASTVMLFDMLGTFTAGQGHYFYGAQIEAGSFATSYIPTAAATVTRNADVAFVATSQFPYSATEGTLVVNADAIGFPSSQFYAELGDGTYNNRISLLLSSNTGLGIVDVGGVRQASLSIGSVSANVPAKNAIAYKANDFAAVTNGGAVTTDASGTVPTATALYLGYQGGGGGTLNGHIRQITYIPRRLTNAELQARTA